MSRDLTAGMASAVAASNVRPFVLLEFTSTVATVRIWSGLGPLSWNGNTYVGLGDLISISAIEENDDLKATGVSVKVAGATISSITQALAELRTGQPGNLKLGLFDNAGAIISSPKTMFRGKLDGVVIEDKDAEKPGLVLSFESQLIDLRRPREWRYTNQNQQRLYPGDTGFRFVEAVQDKTLTWGWR